MVTPAEFELLFECSPIACLALDPKFMIAAVSNYYLRITKTYREELIGRNYFEAFPYGLVDLRDSLNRVVRTKIAHQMEVQNFEDRYWIPMNNPVFGVDGRIRFIIHSILDVTPFVKTES